MNTKNITTILFDLDGTLLPFNETTFMEGYLSLFALKCQQVGIDEDNAIEALFSGLDAMKDNDGSTTNELLFWKVFFSSLGGYNKKIEDALTDFYLHEFRQLIATTYPSPHSATIIQELTSKGYRIVVATNPVFPKIGTLERMRWAGLNPCDFEIITAYEDYSYTKPKLGYYYEVFSKLGVQSNEVLMVGNNILEDGVITETGATCIFVADHLINPENRDIEDYEIYSLSGLAELVKEFPKVSVKEERA